MKTERKLASVFISPGVGCPGDYRMGFRRSNSVLAGSRRM